MGHDLNLCKNLIINRVTGIATLFDEFVMLISNLNIIASVASEDLLKVTVITPGSTKKKKLTRE